MPHARETAPRSAGLPPVIGLFSTFLYGHYYGDITAGVADAAELANVSVLAHQTGVGVLSAGYYSVNMDTSCPAAWDHLDAAIVVNAGVTADYVSALRAAGTPVITITQDDLGAYPTVAIDNAGGIRAALEHLIEHGHSSIGFVGGTEAPCAPDRYRAYRAVMAAHGLAPLPQIAHDAVEFGSDEHGYLAAKRYLTDGLACTAVVANTDGIAIGFMRGLTEAGWAFPQDLAVIGVDDIEQAALHTPPLSSVRIDFGQIGEVAFDLALRAANSEDVTGRHEVPTLLVPRESCGCSTTLPVLSSQPDQATDSFVLALSAAARDGVPPDLAELVDVAPLAGRVLHLLGANAPPGAADQSALDALGADLYAMCSQDRAVDVVVAAIRGLTQTMVAELGSEPATDGAAVASSVWGTALDLCRSVMAAHLRGRMSAYLHLKRMLVKQNFVGTGLLQRDHDELRSLGWLWRTEAIAGALALWETPGDWESLVVTGVYDAATPGRQIDPLPQRPQAFPPRWLLTDGVGRGRLVFLLPVRFEQSDWGVLAVTGTHEMRSTVVHEMFRQWVMLITVALDHERASDAVIRQERALTTARDTELALLEEVRLSEERYALAAEAANDGLWDWDLRAGTVYYSGRWKSLLGYADGDIGATPDEWLGRVHPEDLAQVQSLQNETVKTVVEFEHRLRDSNGDYRWMACRGRAIFDDYGQVRRLVGSITDITVRRLLQDQLLRQALYDDLTGLAKRALFMDRINRAIAMTQRRADYWFAVLFVDLDGFKAVNDVLGHAAGDQVLVSVAQRLSSSLRANDTAARLGGDEFAVLLNDVRDEADLPMILERLQSQLAAPHVLGEITATVTAAIGVAISLTGYVDAAKILRDADGAMYEAKALGGGAYVISNPPRNREQCDSR